MLLFVAVEMYSGRTIARLDGFIGAEASLILLEDMKTRASLTAPDTFTYTTVISGVVRAEVIFMSGFTSNYQTVTDRY